MQGLKVGVRVRHLPPAGCKTALLSGMTAGRFLSVVLASGSHPYVMVAI